MKVGDRVKIINSGKIYSTYYEMNKKLGFSNPNDFKRCTGTPKQTFTIFGISPHLLNANETCYAIRDDVGLELLIEVRGLKPVISEVESQIFPRKMFVWNTEHPTNPVERIVVADLGEKCKCGRFQAVDVVFESAFIKGEEWMSVGWVFASDTFPVAELTMDEIAEKFNIPIERLKIKK